MLMPSAMHPTQTRSKNRIVRRIFESLGYKVMKLDRVMFAGLTKKGLKRGDWRFLTEKEVAYLHMGAYE